MENGLLAVDSDLAWRFGIYHVHPSLNERELNIRTLIHEHNLGFRADAPLTQFYSAAGFLLADLPEFSSTSVSSAKRDRVACGMHSQTNRARGETSDAPRRPLGKAGGV